MKELNFYKNSAEIGNHERIYNKIGEFYNNEDVCRITYISNNYNATIIYKDKEIKANTGMILGANVILKTNNSIVELKTSKNGTIRLSYNSEICLENTIEGIKPVFYGDIYLESVPGKYRTSCYGKGEEIIIKAINKNTDTYYTLNSELEVYEYDEDGNRFTIFRLEPYQKCILIADFNKSMRNRYKIESISDIEAKEIEKLYMEFVIPNNWNKKYNSETNIKNVIGA